jgi:hypothetical protein
MVTLLITSFFIIGVLALAIYFWQKPASTIDTESELPPATRRALFDSPASGQQLPDADEERAMTAARQRTELLDRAKRGEKSALNEAQTAKDAGLYDAVLNSLVTWADADAKLLSLVSHVMRNELPVNTRLAEAFIQSWQNAPERSSTAKMLHIAALSDDAGVYQTAAEAALHFWRDGRLPGVSGPELRAILDGEFWILSSRTRKSGAGFLLKRTLASARPELENTKHD